MANKIATSLEKLIKESPIKAIFRKTTANNFNPDTPEPESTLYGMIRRGKTLEGTEGLQNVINEITYSILGISKDEHSNQEGTGLYDQRKVKIKRRIEKTNTLFQRVIEKFLFNKSTRNLELNIQENQPTLLSLKNLSVGERRDKITAYLKSSLKRMINETFGEDVSKAFNYGHKIHLQNNEQRAGTNRYFAHVFRTAIKVRDLYNKYDINGTEKQTTLAIAFLHDIVESAQKARRKKIEKINAKINNKSTLEHYTPIRRKVKLQIRRPPELKSAEKEDGIESRLRTVRGLDEKFVKKAVTALSNYKALLYEEYVREMIDQVRELKEDYDKELYLAPLIVKLADSVDNTETIGDLKVDNRVKRLTRNASLLENVINFVEEEELDIKENLMLYEAINNLLEVSLGESDSETADYNHRAVSQKEKKGLQKQDYHSYTQISERFREVRKNISQLQERFKAMYHYE